MNLVSIKYVIQTTSPKKRANKYKKKTFKNKNDTIKKKKTIKQQQ